MKTSSRSAPRVPAQSGPLPQERVIRALVALVDDLTIERDEAGLLGSSLDRVVAALGLTGGAAYAAGLDDFLEVVAEKNLADIDPAVAREFVDRAFTAGRPAAHELPEGGWLAAAPLVTRRRTLGVLLLHDARRESVAPDMDLLQALGRQIGTGLDNVRLYAELRASSARVEALNRITATLT